MKKLIALTIALFALNSQAKEIAPTYESIYPSTVERVIQIQKETMDQPSIRLVQVDNGGSSDISAYVNPSRAYLTFHKDGEMFDINGNYEISHGVVSNLKVNDFDKANGVVIVSYKRRSSEDFSIEENVTAEIKFANAIKEIKNAREDEDFSYEMESSINMDIFLVVEDFKKID